MRRRRKGHAISTKLSRVTNRDAATPRRANGDWINQISIIFPPGAHRTGPGQAGRLIICSGRESPPKRIP
ncbi:hypothetical protein Btru_066327 [Bulinus truncatus]|nr:hypothetical protein Btru_066327 [Bulinus truncatus]